MSSALKSISKLELEGWVRAEVKEVDKALDELQKEKAVIQVGDGAFVHSDVFSAFRQAAMNLAGQFHKKNPLRPGMPREELRADLKADQKIFSGLLPLVRELVSEKDSVRLASFQAALSGKDEQFREKIIRELEAAGFQPPEKSELAKKLALDEKRLTDVLRLMDKEGVLVRINETLYLPSSVFQRMISLLKGFFAKKPEMAVSEFRDVLGTTRKYALPYLEYLDSHKLTMRVGDTRKPLKGLL
jgi:selenocysteine-specific elongation factor